MRWLLPILLLSLGAAPFALADEAEGPSIEEQIRELETKRARLVEERDAARMRANVYVLPKDKLEAEEKQGEIEEVDREIAALREAGKKAKDAPSARESEGPR